MQGACLCFANEILQKTCCSLIAGSCYLLTFQSVCGQSINGWVLILVRKWNNLKQHGITVAFFLTLCWFFGGRSECKIFDNQHKSSEIRSVRARGEILEAFQALRQRGREESCCWLGREGWMALCSRQARQKQLEGVSHFFNI